MLGEALAEAPGLGVAPGEARFQLELAERYWRVHQEAKALATAKKIEGRFPSDPAVMSAVADLYLRWSKDDLALAAFERLARLHSFSQKKATMPRCVCPRVRFA